MNVLLLSAYDTPSHRYWCEGLQQHLDDINWSYLTLPARYFSWRIRGNPLSWFATQHNILSADYDVIIATSMVDLATLCGLFPNLAACHKVIYFHENQFAYPQSDKQVEYLEAMMVHLYSALCADRVVFNSQFNRTSYLNGAAALLKKMPDYSPVDVLKSIEQKSRIIPVPISKRSVNNKTTKIKNSIVWNHRWEYDKNPEDFFHACKLLKEWGVEFKLMVMGQQFRKQPQIFDQAKEIFADHILCWGEQQKESYLEWLHQSEWVISTAIHEFQGVAVMEAVQAGCRPAVPDRLSYPEWFDSSYRYGQTAEELALFLKRQFETSDPDSEQDIESLDLNRFTWGELTEPYRNLLQP